MRNFDIVHHVTGDRAMVGADARWIRVWEATLPLGTAPLVLADYVDLSVGETLCVLCLMSVAGQARLQRAVAARGAVYIDGIGAGP